MASKSGSDRSKVSRETSQQQKRGAPTASNGWGELQLQTASGSVTDRKVVDAPENWGTAWKRLRARNPSVTDFAPCLVPNPATRNQFLNPRWRELTEADVRSYMMEELKSTLSTSDYEQFQQHGLAVPDDAGHKRICSAIDEFIFQAAVQYGFEISLLPEVGQRVFDWVHTEDQGDKRCDKFGGRLAQGARVRQGTALAPLKPWWVRSRSAIISEVKLLKQFLPDKLPTNRTPTKGQLLAATLDTIEENESKFPKLLRIGASFPRFLMWNTRLLGSLLEDEITPGNFTGELIRSVTNYKPDSSRQLISRGLSETRFCKSSPSSDL
jgi:hypothetical protein